MVAANGALMRTSPTGIVQFHDLNKVIENTKELSMVRFYIKLALIHRQLTTILVVLPVALYILRHLP